MDVLAISCSTVDIFLRPERATIRERENGQTELALPYPEKIGVRNFKLSPGGNALNTGASLLKLGHSVSLYTIIGNDPFGEVLRRHFQQWNYQTDYVRQHGETDIATILSCEDDRTILVHHPSNEWRWTRIDEAPDWIYLSSLGTKDFQNFHQQLLAYLQHHDDVRLGYNPGKREVKAAVNQLHILSAVDVLLLNKEEATRLMQKESVPRNTQEMHALARDLRDQGPDTVVITDGVEGAYGLNAGGFFHQPAFPTNVVEKTGAGDGFSSGVIGALLQEKTLPEALRWGTAISHSVIENTGATEGLLTEEELLETLDEFPADQ